MQALVIVALIITLAQVYLIINKLWKRKHEAIVADSISIYGHVLGLANYVIFAIYNLVNLSWLDFSSRLLWIIAATVQILIGTGLWVTNQKDTSFRKLLKKALRKESKEVGDLAKTFFRPSSSEKIINILGHLAIVDNALHDKEKQFIETFANAWGIKISWDKWIEKMTSNQQMGYVALRNSMVEYLNTSPPIAQVNQLTDVLKLLVNIDNDVADEEELILTELDGLIKNYLGDSKKQMHYRTAVVPQEEEQEKTIALVLPELKRHKISGGYAYVSEKFYSKQYAEIICDQYRALKFFSVVIESDGIGEQLSKSITENQFDANLAIV